jgi:hypothetical protein
MGTENGDLISRQEITLIFFFSSVYMHNELYFAIIGMVHSILTTAVSSFGLITNCYTER